MTTRDLPDIRARAASAPGARAPVAALVACGVVLVGACSIPLVNWARAGGGLHPGGNFDSYASRPYLLLAAAPYLVALWLLRRRAPRALVLVPAAIAFVVLVIPPPYGSRDIFSYVFYGKMITHGFNPFVFGPSHMSGDPWFAFVLWKTMPTVYGPVWTYIHAGIAGVSGPHLWVAITLAKLVPVGGAVAGSLCVSSLGHDETDRTWRLAACLWNPLVLFTTGNTGHVDGALLGLVGGALLARARGKPILTVALLTAATLVKAYCAVFLGLYLVELLYRRRVRLAVTSGAGAVVAAAALYAPYWRGRATFTGLTDISTRFSHPIAYYLRNGFRALLSTHVGVSRATTLGSSIARAVCAIVLVAVIAWCVLKLRHEERAPALWGASFGAYLLLTPWFLPWYTLPLLAIALAQEQPLGQGAALTAVAVSFSVASQSAIPEIRYLVPALLGAAVWWARRGRIDIARGRAA
ncbi:MAG: glycosyltransferase 87 family protein [Actinomycetota bacterium]